MRSRRDKQRIIAEFNAYNLHDDTVHAIRIIPSTSRRRNSIVEVDLTQYVSNKPRRLRLTGCANITFVADFAVLTDNAFANTERVQAFGDEERIHAIILSQMGELNIEYLDEHHCASEEHPSLQKLKKISSYVLFRIAFYGGTLEVIAEGFRITRPRANPLAA
jgi:hypothetical protein